MLLAIETSCDETSVAIAREGRIVSNVVSSQVRLHAEYGGVVPELATREHLKNLMPVAREALGRAGTAVQEIEAIAATQGPGLPAALMIGFQAGQALAFSLGKRFLGVHHHEAHLYSPWIDPATGSILPVEPNISLIVSGGHTLLVHVMGELEHKLLGSTVDDAAGECFDKTAKLIGLPYPGGPQMDHFASEGNPNAFDFPRPLLNDASDDFSFSGLKTSVRYFLRDNPGLLKSGQGIRDLCASVQRAIVEVLVVKTVRAAKRVAARYITASGGVTCNRALRHHLSQACEENGIRLQLSSREFCTDNAGMIAALALRQFRKKSFAPTPTNADVLPTWNLEPR